MALPPELQQTIAEKPTSELQLMLLMPGDWLPEAVEIARSELARRTRIVAERPNVELLAILRHPDGWPPEDLEIARSELARRGVDFGPEPVKTPPGKAPLRHEPTPGDIKITETLLTAGHSDDQIVAALIYRGLDQAAAVKLVERQRRAARTVNIPPPRPQHSTAGGTTTRQEVRLPHLCAWCGATPAEFKRSVILNRTFVLPTPIGIYRSRNALTCTLPICKACGPAVGNARRLITIAGFKGAAIGLALVLLGTCIFAFCTEGKEARDGVLLFGFFCILWVPSLSYWLATMLKKEQIPHDTSWGTYSFSSRAFIFRNKQFAQEFSKLNPRPEDKPEVAPPFRSAQDISTK